MDPNSVFLFDMTVILSLLAFGLTLLVWRILRQKKLQLRITQLGLPDSYRAESILVMPSLVSEPEVSISTSNRKFKPTVFASEQYDQLDQEIVYCLLTTYPNMTWLELRLDYVSGPLLSRVICLLQNWAHTLTGLKLSFASLPPDTEGHMRTLIWVVSQMKALTSLTFDVEGELFPSQANKQLDLPVLARLREFNFSSVDGLDVVLDSLLRYGTTSCKLWHIGLGNVINDQWWDQFLGMRLDFAFCFSHLKLHHPTVSPDQLRIFCSKFCSLVALSFQMGKLSLHRTVYCLAPLTKLVHLELDIDFRQHESFVEEDELDTSKFAQLSSVKVVTLLLDTTTHNNLKSAHLQWIFPFVQVLRIWQRSHACSVCGWNVILEGSGQARASTTQQCKRHLLQPWKQCTSLQHIFTGIRQQPQEWPLDRL